MNAFTNKPTWIIDPIDGTMNFVHSNPLVVTSVGLAINKQLVLGIINAPLIGHMYTAIKGRGAYMNGDKIQTCSVKKLSEALVIMEISVGGNERKKNSCLANLAMLSEKAHAVRCPGPAALDIAWVGGGSADAYFHSGFHCWDMAAGAVIVKEAGGAVHSPSGGQADLMSRGILVAASEELASELSKSIDIYSVEPEYPLPCPI
jgi:myo-inositol-1(or 4)-monophosphatase